MEKNNYICPECGSKMNENYEKPALNLTCPKCGCKIATTRWDDIDLDETIYRIILKPTNEININKVKLISKLTVLNYIQSKEKLISGGILISCKAIEVTPIINELNMVNLKYIIDPEFPWK